jgi:hypothetical protein
VARLCGAKRRIVRPLNAVVMPLPSEEHALVERIYAAFSEAARPAADDIAPHPCCECAEVAARLVPHQSREVPVEDMSCLADSLPLLSPRALRYFLPRYLEFTLTNPESIARDNVLYHLSAEHASEEYWVERYRVFSQNERFAIAEYLRYRQTWPDAKWEAEHMARALENWDEAA